MLLDKVEATNQLVECCEIYLSTDLFITELECLVFFNHFVTFPFLKCVEVSNQDQLVEIFPKLYNDLLDKKTHLEKLLFQFMAFQYTRIINGYVKRDYWHVFLLQKRQCGREYGFSDGQDLRATNISNLTPEQQAGLHQ